MEISLSNERAFQLLPQIDPERAQALVEEKKANLVAGMVGALLSRPKPEDIRLVYSERRLEPFWHVAVHLRTVYDRNRSYAVPVGGAEVKRVTVMARTLAVDGLAKGGPSFALEGIEHCEEDLRVSQAFDGEGNPKPGLVKLLDSPKREIADLSEFKPEGVIVVLPQSRASAVVRQVMSEVLRPVKAQVILEERADVEAIDLYFRPAYAYEFLWVVKDKRVIVEMDALSGEMRTGGKTLKDRLQSVVTRDFLFDVTADAVGMIVPGGGIAVKLVKAGVDRKR